jgi:hypothetical protein
MRPGGKKVGDILRIAGIQPIPTNITRQTTNDIFGRNQERIVAPNNADLGAVVRNRQYIEQLRREVGILSARLSAAQQRTSNRYYNRLTGNYQPFPPVSSTTTLGNRELFINAAKQLATLVENQIVSLDTDINVQEIDLDTGEFTTSLDEQKTQAINSALGFPLSGIIRLTDRVTNVNRFGSTYTSVDIKAMAVFAGNFLAEVKGLTGISWSRHKDKNSDRATYQDSPKKFTPGAKTYAGTMIFALFDEDPIRAVSPLEYFHGNSPIAPSSGLTSFEELESTEMPSFDLTIVFHNEYGASSAMNIWGITFTDDGGSITTRQLENEVAYQYKAVAIDPIVPVKKGFGGEVNPFEPTAQGATLYEKKRRLALMRDVAGQNFESVYLNTIDNIKSQLNF